MKYQRTQSLLPELQHIETIIAQDDHQFLTTEVIETVTYKELELPVYSLSMGNTARELPRIVFVGGIHGLERIGTQVVLTFLDTLLMRLKWDQAFTDMLQHVHVSFLPLSNPVGMIRHTRSNGQGIDLMRNAPVDCTERALWLGGGHRISLRLPWYRGKGGGKMEVEPQALNYLTNGDLWDYLYQQSLSHQNIFLPLTLEMGSWRWIRMNPLQLRNALGLFHPIKPHRTSRVLRGHLILMDFLLRAVFSYKKWLYQCDIRHMTEQAMACWYR